MTKTYPPDVLKEELEKELGFKFLEKDYLKQIMTDIAKVLFTDVKDLFGKEAEKTETVVEIPDIFNEKMKQEIETKNEFIKRFGVPETGFCLKNDSDCIRKLFCTATESNEYKTLIDFVNKHLNVLSMNVIHQNIIYYEEAMIHKKEKWKGGNIPIKDDTARNIASDFMKVFEEDMVNTVISNISSKLEYDGLSEQDEQIYLEFLEILNKYISAMGIYAPCDVLGGIKYDADDIKCRRFNSTRFSISDDRIVNYIHSVDRLPYILDYTYNKKTKHMCINGKLFCLVKG